MTDKKIKSLILAVTLLSSFVPQAGAHPVKRITARSIYHFEENYYVWTPNRPWRVWGKVSRSTVARRLSFREASKGLTGQRGRPIVFSDTAVTASAVQLLRRG